MEWKNFHYQFVSGILKITYFTSHTPQPVINQYEYEDIYCYKHQHYVNQIVLRIIKTFFIQNEIKNIQKYTYTYTKFFASG